MAQSPQFDPNAAYSVPAFDPSAAYEAAAPALDLSNKQGQGTYSMWDTNGKMQQVPYGQVATAAHQGYHFDTNPTKTGLTPQQQFFKDLAADPSHTGGAPMSFTPAAGDPRGDVGYQQQMEANAPAAIQLASGIAKGAGTIASPALDAMNYAANGKTDTASQMLQPNSNLQRAGKWGTIAAAAVPAAVAAPVATAGGVLAGTAGAGAGQLIGNAAGMSPGATRVLSDTLGLAGGAAGAAGAPSAAAFLNTSARKEAAAGLLQSVAHDANKIPVQLTNSGDAALSLMDWQKKTQLGPTVNKFLNRITNPKLGPMTYEEARDYYQLLGKLSSDETMKMAPPVRRDLVQMVVGLKQDIGDAAEQVGRGADYLKGMGDYANAAKHQQFYDNAKDWLLKNGVPAALGGGGLATAWHFLQKSTQ